MGVRTLKNPAGRLYSTRDKRRNEDVNARKTKNAVTTVRDSSLSPTISGTKDRKYSIRLQSSEEDKSRKMLNLHDHPTLIFDKELIERDKLNKQ